MATSAGAPASGEVLIVHALLNTDLTSRLINGDWACREVGAEQCRRYGLHGLALRAAAARHARMLRSPKLQCKSGRPALGSSRSRLRTPASARHSAQSSTGRDNDVVWLVVAVVAVAVVVTGRRLRCLDVPCDGCCEVRASLRRATGIGCIQGSQRPVSRHLSLRTRRNCSVDLNNVASNCPDLLSVRTYLANPPAGAWWRGRGFLLRWPGTGCLVSPHFLFRG